MAKHKIFLSVIVPVFNEERTVKSILSKVLNKLPPESEVVIVNDGSTDKTGPILKSFNKNKRVVVFDLKKNFGKGYAVRYGLKKAKGEVFLIQDADLEYDPADYKRLLKPIKQKKVQVVYGSRLANYPLSISTIKSIPLPLHFLANKLLTFFTNLLYGSHLTDMETCYKVFTRKVYKDITLTKNKFDFEVEITAKILLAGYNIQEISIKTTPRSYKEGKKITWKDGISALLSLIEFRLNYYLILAFGVTLLGVVVRFWNFSNRYGLWSDQARDAIVGRISIVNRTLPLIGSFSSAGPFTFGPFWYWHSILMNLVFKTHMGYWIGMGIASVLMIIALLWMGKQICGRFMSIFAGLLGAVSLTQLQSSLNATQHSMVGVVTTFYLVVVILYIKHGKSSQLFWVGFLLSFSMNFHYQTVYLMPMIIILLLAKRPSIKGLFSLGLGLFIPFIPLLIFDLQHDWWNLEKVIDYYRFGQYRIYVPNRWLTYGGVYWPTYWAKTAGGFPIIAYITMTGVGLVFIYKLIRRQLKTSTLVFGLGFLASIVWFRYFRGERYEGYAVYSQPFIYIFTAWLVNQLRKKYLLLGIIVASIIVLGSINILKDNFSYRNSYSDFMSLKTDLLENIPAQSYALYDRGFHTSGCSISLSLLLDDDKKSSSKGTAIGLCLKNQCLPEYPVITQVKAGGMNCTLVDLQNTSGNKLEKQNWVLVSPEEVHRMTVEWWKKEGI